MLLSHKIKLLYKLSILPAIHNAKEVVGSDVH